MKAGRELFTDRDTGGVSPKLLSNQSPLASANKWKELACDCCGIGFRRHVSQIRGARILCSRACFDEIRRIPVKHNCVVCAKEMTHRPSAIRSHATCSPECSSLRKAYDAAAKAVRVEGQRISVLANELGVNESVVRLRVKRGVSYDAALPRGAAAHKRHGAEA